MFRSLARCFNRSDVYSTGSLVDDCSEKFVCCVYEGDHKEDARCCDLGTVDESSIDIFQCGNMHDSDNMSAYDLSRKRTLSYIRWLLFSAVIVVGMVGGMAILRPETVVFNTLADDVSSARLNEGIELQEEARRLEQELNDKMASDRDSKILMTFINKVFSSKDTTQDERRVINGMMERAALKIDSAGLERVTIVSPMIIYGALCIYYAIKCAMGLLHTQELRESITYDHGLWCICNLIGYVIATTQGHGMKASNVTIFLLIYYGLLCCSWLFIHQRILYTTYTPRHEHHVASSTSTITSSSTSSSLLSPTSF